MKQIPHETDFYIVAGWALFYPAKTSMAYYLGFAFLAGIYLGRSLLGGRHLASSRFTTGLTAVTLILILSVLAAPNRQSALLFLSDLILAGLVVAGFDNGRRDRRRAVLGLARMITFMSLVTVILRLAGLPPSPGFFFTNPILQGVLSGLAALILFHRLVRKPSALLFTLCALNLLGVFASASKAAFIGTVVFGFLTIPLRRRRWMLGLTGIAILAFLIPNPVRDMFQYSLTRDPYATNRIDIWAMSLRMGRALWPWGTGLGGFAAAAPAYNFPQKKGPANYFKVPRQTHNDYLKLLVEAGVFGLAAFLILAAGVLRRLIRGGRGHPGVTAVFYMLFQAFLFNLLFHLAFLLLFLFLLDDWIDAPPRYHSPAPGLRPALGVFLLFLGTFSYLFPYLASTDLHAAAKETDFLYAFDHARRAARLTPLSPGPQFLLADLYRVYSGRTHSLEALARARNHLQHARRLNPFSADAPRAEAALLATLIPRNLKYSGLEDEIMDCLDRARDAAPLDPFVRMQRARIRLEFGHDRAAVREARAALELEPRCLQALVFLRRHSRFPGGEAAFRGRVVRILKLRQRLAPARDSYLGGLFSLPPGDRGWLRATYPDLRLPPLQEQTLETGKIR